MGWRLLDVILAGPLWLVALFGLGVFVTKAVLWFGIKVGVRRLLCDWRLWLLVAGVYLAFSADWVVQHYGRWPAWLLLAVLVAFCFWSIRLGVAEYEQQLRRRGYYREG